MRNNTDTLVLEHEMGTFYAAPDITKEMFQDILDNSLKFGIMETDDPEVWAIFPVDGDVVYHFGYAINKWQSRCFRFVYWWTNKCDQFLKKIERRFGS